MAVGIHLIRLKNIFNRRRLFIFIEREEDPYASRGDKWRGQDSGPYIDSADTLESDSLNYKVAKGKKS